MTGLRKVLHMTLRGRHAVFCLGSVAASARPARDPGEYMSPALMQAATGRDVYAKLVSRAFPLRACAVAEQVLADPSVEVPDGTRPLVVPPYAIGSGVDHADTWSLVFLPDDGRSPIERVVFDRDGTIIAWTGPHRRGA